MFERADARLCSMSPTMATVKPLEAPCGAGDREGVEQRLRRVLVRAVAGVDDAGLQLAGQQVRHARRAGGASR